jgi:hypothetical protein
MRDIQCGLKESAVNCTKEKLEQEFVDISLLVACLRSSYQEMNCFRVHVLSLINPKRHLQVTTANINIHVRVTEFWSLKELQHL